MSDETHPPAPDARPEEAAQEPQTSPQERLAAAEAEIARLKDEVLRAVAEQDNIRKRGERALADTRTFAIDRFARDLLAISDNLSRALETDGDATILREGVKMTAQALADVFERHGLKPVGAKGDRFDPNLHQAVAQIPSDAPAGAIAEVMQVGWVLADRTLRAAMVAVSAGGQAATPGDGGGAEPGGHVNVTA